MIEVRNLVKRYGEHTAVENLSFTIEKGQVYGFLGPNGAGKSTTMNIMTGYLSPTSGEVLINGHSIMDEPELAKRSIGYLPEQPPLYTDMTVREYLAFVSALKKIPKNERAAGIEEVLNLTRTADVADRLVGNLSKGYRQRVGVAQAILGMPDVIILDEPTVGLDPNQIIDTRELIRNLGKERTVILSSHILSEIQEICDHIIIIHKGQLIANGTAAELEDRLGATNMELTFKSDSESDIRALLSGFKGISKQRFEKNNAPGEISVTLKLLRGTDLREEMFSACVAKNIPLLMMRSVNMSLESIFIELTGDKSAEKKKSGGSQSSSQDKKSANAPEAKDTPAPAEAEAAPASDAPSGTDAAETTSEKEANE